MHPKPTKTTYLLKAAKTDVYPQVPLPHQLCHLRVQQRSRSGPQGVLPEARIRVQAVQEGQERGQHLAERGADALRLAHSVDFGAVPARRRRFSAGNREVLGVNTFVFVG